MEMNHSYLYTASRDYIFVFSLQDMQQIAQIKVSNHFLRISMSPNCPQLDSIRAPGMQNGGKLPFIAYSEHL